MNFTLGSHKTVKRGKEPLIAAFVPPKTRDLDPSSYFPNSFSRRGLLGNLHSYTRIPIRYRGVGKWARSTGFLEKLFGKS
jgi:hypothetical protein